jgi:hypothetical protein
MEERRAIVFCRGDHVPGGLVARDDVTPRSHPGNIELALINAAAMPAQSVIASKMNANLNKSSSQTTAKRPSAMQQKHRDDNQKTFPPASRYPDTAPRKNVNPQEVSNEDPIAGRHGSGAGGKQSDTGGRGSSGENPRAAIAGMRKR